MLVQGRWEVPSGNTVTVRNPIHGLLHTVGTGGLRDRVIPLTVTSHRVPGKPLEGNPCFTDLGVPNDKPAIRLRGLAS